MDGSNVSIECMNNSDFVITEEGFSRSAYLIGFVLLISSPKEVKINFQAYMWFETASSICSGDSSWF